MYEYRARVVHVVDGDTLDLEVDLGFGLAKLDRFRLHGINAPELRGETRDRGALAKLALEALVEGVDDGCVTVRTFRDKREKYGRYLAQVFVARPDGSVSEVGAVLLAEGLAVPYVL